MSFIYFNIVYEKRNTEITSLCGQLQSMYNSYRLFASTKEYEITA